MEKSKESNNYSCKNEKSIPVVPSTYTVECNIQSINKCIDSFNSMSKKANRSANEFTSCIDSTNKFIDKYNKKYGKNISKI